MTDLNATTTEVSAEFDKRSDALWASIDDHDEAEFFTLIENLVAELPAEHPVALFERACSRDSYGHSDLAVPLYREALDRGLSGMRRRRAVIQLSSSLRNVGHVDESVRLLTAERAIDPDTLDEPTRALSDAIAAVLALALADSGREREAVSIAVGALAPHLVRYQRSMGAYARLLVEPKDEDAA